MSSELEGRRDTPNRPSVDSGSHNGIISPSALLRPDDHSLYLALKWEEADFAYRSWLNRWHDFNAPEAIRLREEIEQRKTDWYKLRFEHGSIFCYLLEMAIRFNRFRVVQLLRNLLEEIREEGRKR